MQHLIEQLGSALHEGKGVSATILKQLGGSGRLSAMIGAHTFIDHGSGVSFKWKARTEKPSKTGNYVKIMLNASDEYDLTFQYLRGYKGKVVKTLTGIQASNLRMAIERQTGLKLSLGTMGRREGVDDDDCDVLGEARIDARLKRPKLWSLVDYVARSRGGYLGVGTSRAAIGTGRLDIGKRQAAHLVRKGYADRIEGSFGPYLELTPKGEKFHREWADFDEAVSDGDGDAVLDEGKGMHKRGPSMWSTRKSGDTDAVHGSLSTDPKNHEGFYLTVQGAGAKRWEFTMNREFAVALSDTLSRFLRATSK